MEKPFILQIVSKQWAHTHFTFKFWMHSWQFSKSSFRNANWKYTYNMDKHRIMNIACYLLLSECFPDVTDIV